MKISGAPIYISNACWFDGTDYSLISIGDKTVISSNVRVLTHDYSVSRALYAVGVRLTSEVSSVRTIEIGTNCFIGVGSILMPGCKIGDNCIVGAGSVVRGDIPANSILVGNPAEIVGDVIEFGNSRKQLLEKGLLKKDPDYWANASAMNDETKA